MNFSSLPKIDLHLHLDGALRTKTILELADAAGIALPARTVDELEKHVTVGPECKDLLDFLARFDVFLPVLQNAEAMERVAFELVEDQRKDNVVYFEARYAPLLIMHPGFSLADSVEAVLSGLTRGDPLRRWGLILCTLRSASPELSMETARTAVKYRKHGVVGFDIAGDDHPSAAPHRAAFDYLRQHDFPVTAHAGEAGPASNIREAIDLLGARRIGHGIHVVEDRALLGDSIERGITFEICLTSNAQTRCVPSLGAHPFPMLLRAGARVTLNSDDPAVSRITLSHEYQMAAEIYQLDKHDFSRLYENAVEGAFAEPGLKQWLRSQQPVGCA